MSLTYKLVRRCQNDIKDVAGEWQIEGGEVLQNNEHVANYSSVGRTSCGTKQQNTLMLWLTLFFLKEEQNMTLHGAHNLGSGDEVGSVSAATGGFATYIGKQFKRTGSTLTIA